LVGLLVLSRRTPRDCAIAGVHGDRPASSRS
jgi:hypothetical protein